ncbi:metal-dependent hydrolase [Dyadobacter sp. 32]|uniref:metal-dependent hydrolase n=1 Tax=Dyadobacter sp. 32 TaxID=538966 RepID=UPI0039C6538F
MSGTNHITGGIVFTGIFASFWNVNIFARPEMLAATGFFAILPDIDHLKSPIGKAFYPLAKWLDRKYGHRTITHSLTVFIPGIFLVMFLEKLLSTGFSYTLVFAFAYFSHLLFDMLTKQGVPLFYPFKRNPCVIPGNPDMRLRSSDLKTEAACFAIFILLGITCQNLFTNGFWNTYNRQFADLKHLHQENVQSETMLSVAYKFRNEAGKEISGSGRLIKSAENQAIIWDNNQFIRIEKTDRIISLTPTRTQKMISTKEIFFSNISPDSLRKLLTAKPLITLKLQANYPFIYTKQNQPMESKSADLAYIVDPTFDFINKPAVAADTSTIEARRRILLYELASEYKRMSAIQSQRQNLANQITKLTTEINTLDLYEREKATKELQKLKTELANHQDAEDNTGKIRLQLQALKAKPQAEPEPVKVSGYINMLEP